MSQKTTPNTGQRWRRNRDGQEIDIEHAIGRMMMCRKADTGETLTLDVALLNNDRPHGYLYVGPTP